MPVAVFILFNMATNLIFTGSERSKTDEHQLQCYWNGFNEIFVQIEINNFDGGFICLDLETAKNFRDQITAEILILEINSKNVK